MIEMIWGAVGVAIGVCFATACLTIATIYDEYREEKTNGRRR